MRNTIFFLLSLLLTTCYRPPALIDLDPPQLSGILYYQNYLIFQFNEPVVNFSLQLYNTTIKPKAHIPLANHYVEANQFYDYQNKSSTNDMLIYSASDTSGNSINKEIMIPYVNPQPPDILISSLRLKYTSKRQQYIHLKSKHAGNLRGYTICIYAGRAIRTLQFEPTSLQEHTDCYIYIIYKKDFSGNFIIHSQNGTYYTCTIPWHLSTTCGIVAIYDYRNELCDCIAYYDARNKTLKEYQSSSYYKKLFTFLSDKESIIFSNIEGHSVKKPIVKTAENEVFIR